MFLNAIMLAGLSAAVLPIVLHLLNRARFRRVNWGAMMFLDDTTTRQLDRNRLAQYLLLLLRVLAIALVALAFARPIARQIHAPADAQRLAGVIVIDASASMLHPDQAATRFELARRTALGILGQLKRGDQVGLVVLGRDSDQDIPLTTDMQDVASRLASLTPAAQPADQAEGVRRARSLLSGAPGVPSEIYLIGDRQWAAWAAIRSVRNGDSRVIAIPIGSTDNANAWIESIELLNPPAIANQTAQIEIRIRNGSTTPRTDLPLSISEGEKVLDTTQLYLAAGATEVVRREVRLGKPGAIIITATIAASGMPTDDTRQLAIDIAEPMRVAVITGEPASQINRPSQRDFARDTDYLRLALTPAAVSRDRAMEDAFRFKLYPQENWPELEGDKDRVIVLSDVTALDERRVRQIEQFVFSGGGLLLSPGPRTEPKKWNTLLFRDGEGVAPASIDSVRAAADDVVRWVGISTSHPIFSFYAGRPDPLPPISVLRWAKFIPAESGIALATLQSGDPLMVARSFGRGRVVALATPLDADWSNFPFSSLYLPTMQSTVRWLGSATISSRNIAPGASIEHTFEAPKERVATVVRPDGRTDRVPISIAGGSGTLIYPDTDIPGRYSVRMSGQVGADYLVQPSDAESFLELQDDAQLDAIFSGTGVRRGLSDALEDLVGQSRRTTEWSVPLLAIAMAVMGLELMLAQRSIPPKEVE